MKMDLATDDWQACAVLQIAGGRWVGGGLFTFVFYSAKAQGAAVFTFKGVGVGAGGEAGGYPKGGTSGGVPMGDAGGGILPHDFGKISSSWSDITCTKPFSGWDLNKAWGRLTTLGGGIGVQYALTFITACPPWSLTDNYFASQSVGGFGTGGAGVAGLVLAGGWTYKGVVEVKPKSEYDDMA